MGVSTAVPFLVAVLMGVFMVVFVVVFLAMGLAIAALRFGQGLREQRRQRRNGDVTAAGPPVEGASVVWASETAEAKVNSTVNPMFKSRRTLVVGKGRKPVGNPRFGLKRVFMHGSQPRADRAECSTGQNPEPDVGHIAVWSRFICFFLSGWFCL